MPNDSATDDQVTPEPERILVAVCTYNEAENLPTLIDQIRHAMPAANILVIDDNSPDGTGDWANIHATKSQSLSVMKRAGKQGLGSAIVAAMRHAIDNGYDYMINMDGDLSHDPSAIPSLIEKAIQTDADIVIGSRYVSGGSIEGWPKSRKVISALINNAARKILNLSATDCSNSFRCYRVSKLQTTDLSRIRAKGYAMLEEILWIMSCDGVKVVEIPITFVNRTQGDSKLNLKEAISAITMLMRIAIFR